MVLWRFFTPFGYVQDRPFGTRVLGFLFDEWRDRAMGELRRVSPEAKTEMAEMKQHEARDLYLDGVEAARKGRRASAEQLLRASVALDSRNFRAWLWLAGVVDSPEESIRYLDRVLELVPNEPHALDGIRWAERKIREREAAGDVATPEEGPLTADGVAARVEETPSPEPTEPPVKNRRLRWLWGAVLILGLCLMCASTLSLLSRTGFYADILQSVGRSLPDSDRLQTATAVPAQTLQISPPALQSDSSDLVLPLTPGEYVTPTLTLSGAPEAPETLTPSPRNRYQTATPISPGVDSPSPGT